MSRITVDRLDDLARRRIARLAQVAALPPQPARHAREHWQFTRKPWIHERRPRMLGLSVGEDTPLVAYIHKNPKLADAIAAQYPDLDLEQLLVDPELNPELWAAISLQASTYDPTAGGEDLLALYKPSGISQLLHMTVMDDTIVAPYNIVRTGPAMPAPAILREVSFRTEQSIFVNAVEFYVHPIGLINKSSLNVPVAATIGNTSRGIDLWVTNAPIVPEIRLTSGFMGGTNLPACSMQVIVEPLLRIA